MGIIPLAVGGDKKPPISKRGEQRTFSKAP